MTIFYMSQRERSSGIKSLIPVRVIDKRTGELIPYEEALIEINQLITMVQSLSQQVFDDNYDQLMMDLENAKGSANSYGRKLGYGDYFPELPKTVLAKSRIKEIYLHKLISEGLAHLQLRGTGQVNQGDHKMGYTINLGAVNAQMVTREIVGDRIVLDFKCWEREFIMEFAIPDYIKTRNITKLSLPMIGRKGFSFTIEETTKPTTHQNIGGVDLGKVVPFTMAILDNNTNLIGKKQNSDRLNKIMIKSARLLKEKQALSAKIRSYEKLGLDDNNLRYHRRMVRNKNTQLNAEIAHKIGREIVDTALHHEVGLIHLEDLRWVTGEKYGGRWNHGAQADSIIHKATRAGLRTKRVNPKNTSQKCHNCGTTITHKGRKVRCDSCQTTLDRDYNAAINIAKNMNKNKRFPPANGTMGVTCSATAQSNENIPQSTKQYDKSNLSNTV